MITTVTLNTALDITYTVPQFQVNQLHRMSAYLTVPGGKGVNVARVLKTLGESVIATGYVAGFQGRALLAGLKEEAIPSDFIMLQNGESRRAITILDPSQGTSTELVEEGPTITETEIQELRLKVESLAKDSDWMLFCGSLPLGCPTWIYAELTEIAHHQGAKVGLDTRGDALREGLLGKPDLVKPNEHELADLAGIRSDDDEATLKAISSLVDDNTQLVVVSQGERGALACHTGNLYRIRIPQVAAINPVGSGDSMMAGIITALHRGQDITDALRLGAACGTVNTLHKAAGKVTIREIDTILKEIQIMPI